MKTQIFITDSDFSNTDKSFYYLLGFQPSLGAIILNKNKLTILLDPRYFQNTKKINKDNIRKVIWNNSLKINYLEITNWIDWFISSIIEIINEQSKWKIIIEWNIASVYSKKIKKWINNEVKISNKLYFSDIRITKTENEKAYIKKAINIIDKTFLYIEKLAKTEKLHWKTELEIRGIILNKIFKYGWNWESFNSIVAFGKNSSIPHHSTWKTIIWTWPLLIDMWAIYNWYCSDFTRTIWIWEKWSKEYKEFKKMYKVVKNAHLYAFENAKENMNWKELHTLTNSIIKTKGYEKYFTHWTGHWVGLDIHEKPFINKNSEDIIKNNMVFTIEPGIYFKWKFWIRLEDIVIMENGKLIKYSKVEL